MIFMIFLSLFLLVFGQNNTATQREFELLATFLTTLGCGPGCPLQPYADRTQAATRAASRTGCAAGGDDLFCADGLIVLSLQTDANLTGTMASLVGLSKLTWLEIVDNPRLSGTLPADLGDLPNLKQLYLQNCSLSGSLPLSLGRARKLTSLFVYQNQLNGVVPPLPPFEKQHCYLQVASRPGNCFNLTSCPENCACDAQACVATAPPLSFVTKTVAPVTRMKTTPASSTMMAGGTSTMPEASSMSVTTQTPTTSLPPQTKEATTGTADNAVSSPEGIPSPQGDAAPTTDETSIFSQWWIFVIIGAALLCCAILIVCIAKGSSDDADAVAMNAYQPTAVHAPLSSSMESALGVSHDQYAALPHNPETQNSIKPVQYDEAATPTHYADMPAHLTIDASQYTEIPASPHASAEQINAPWNHL